MCLIPMCSRSQRETDEQHRLSCKDAEQKLFAGPLKDGPVLSITFIAQAKENDPKPPKMLGLKI